MQTVVVFDPFSFRIGDTSNLSPYAGRGIVTQYKKPTSVNARSLSATLQQPYSRGSEAFDFSRFDDTKLFRGINLHIGLQALWEFESLHGRTPAVGNADDANEIVRLANVINATLKQVQRVCGTGSAAALDELDEDAIRKYGLYAGAELQPLAAFFGGVTAQEIVKACAKFRPLDQWFHFDAFEVLPEAVYTGGAPIDSRYYHLIRVFGPEFQEKLSKQKTFLVGCGALGCEFFKNFALLGLGSGEGGVIHCTDNYRIEVCIE